MGKTTIKCPKCGKHKPESHFYTKTGRRLWSCRECTSDYQREYRLKHSKRIKKLVRNSTLKSKYGISTKEYRKMFKEQEGVCAICGVKVRGRNMCVDHDHETGDVRGLLCANCNVAIGLLGDSISNLKNASKYLIKYGGQK